MSTIGDNIRKRREEIGLTQEELAKKLNYKSRSTINKIEMGINDISQSKIMVIANALNVPPSFLMGWDNDYEYDTDNDKNSLMVKESNSIYNKNIDLTSILKNNKNDMLKCIAKIIRSKRIKNDITEKTLALKSEITLDDYLKFELEGKIIGNDKIIRIVDVLDIDFNYFLGILSGLQFTLNTINTLDISNENRIDIKEKLINQFNL